MIISLIASLIRHIWPEIGSHFSLTKFIVNLKIELITDGFWCLWFKSNACLLETCAKHKDTFYKTKKQKENNP